MKLILSIFVFLILFTFTNINDTVMPDESIVAVLNQPLKIPVSKFKYQGINEYTFQKFNDGINKSINDPVLFYKTQNDMFPILYQDRHSGLGFFFFKFLYNIFSPKNTILIFHVSLSVLFLIISFYLFRNIFGKDKADSFVLFCALHPIFQIEYSHNISEQFNKFFIIFIIYFLHKKKLNYTGIFLGLMIINKLSSVFCILPYLLYLIMMDSLSLKDLRRILIPLIVIIMPYLLLIDFNELLLNRENIIVGEISDSVIHYPFKDLFNFLFNPINFHGVFFDENFLLGNIGFGSFNYWKPMLVAIPFIIVTILKSDKFRLMTFFISIILFAIIVHVLIPNMAIKSYYFNDLFVMFGLFIAFIYHQRKDIILLFCLMIPVSVTWGVHYNKGLVPLMSLNIYEKLVDEVKKDERVYIVGEGDIGVVEFLTKNKKETIILSYDSFENYKQLISENKGTFIIYNKDVISDHFWKIEDKTLIYNSCSKKIGHDESFFCVIRN